MTGIIIALAAFIVCIIALIVGYIMMEDCTARFYRSVNLTIVPTVIFPDLLSSKKDKCIVIITFPIFGSVAVDKVEDVPELDSAGFDSNGVNHYQEKLNK